MDDLFVALMTAPYAADTVTTVLRLVDAALRRQARVQVWTCGYATTLTARTVGTVKPRDLRDLSAVHPSTATLVGELLAGYPDRLRWQVCRFCSEDRGVPDQIPAVSVLDFSKFRSCVRSARRTVYIGGA